MHELNNICKNVYPESFCCGPLLRANWATVRASCCCGLLFRANCHGPQFGAVVMVTRCHSGLFGVKLQVMPRV